MSLTMKLCKVGTILFITLNSLCYADCNLGQLTRYAYPGDKNYDSGSGNHKGNRSNQLRSAGIGYQKIRRTDQAWSVQAHPGSCAVLGTKKSIVLGLSSNKQFDKDGTPVNPMLEMTISNGSTRFCCWEDSGSDKTADLKILKKPKTPQIVVDLFDPNGQLKAIDALKICSIKVVGECLNENHKGINPKLSPFTQPESSMLVSPDLLQLLDGGLENILTPLKCDEFELI